MSNTAYFMFSIVLVGAASVYGIFRWERKIRRRQDAMLTTLRGKRFWRVQLSRSDFYLRRWRFLIYEAQGFLVDEGEQVRILGVQWTNREAFEVLLQKGDISLTYVPRQWSHRTAFWAQCTVPGQSVRFCVRATHARQSRESLQDLAQSVFPDCMPYGNTLEEFGLHKNARLRSFFALVIALVLIGILGLVWSYSFELEDAQFVRILRSSWLPTLVCCIFAATTLLGYQWLRRGKVQIYESTVLSLTLAITLVFNSATTARVIDQQLAIAPVQNYRYKVTGIAALEPVEKTAGLPPLHFSRSRAYWKKIPLGSEIFVPLLHGRFGSWQLDHRRFDAAMDTL